tara:strand:+ start:4999 stop:5490 length:492 start_codon:yes stop_codon:yes gene_type:complete
MLIGVISDTHNNFKNISRIIEIFNDLKVDLVIHTGDITNTKSLELFSNLKSKFVGVFGNNDRKEPNLKEKCESLGFNFYEPPYTIEINKLKIGIFHEPENIEEFIFRYPETSVIFHGHTHKYRNEVINSTLVINPGESAGMIEGLNAIGLFNTTSKEFKRIRF